MAIGFAAADFAIIPNGDQLPMPVRDEQGFTRYRASIMLPSRSEYNALVSYQSSIDIAPALGGGGTLIVVAGTGKRTLTYPAESGTEEVVQAILLSVQAQVRVLHDTHITADAEWILVG